MIAVCGNIQRRSRGPTGEESSRPAQESVAEFSQKFAINHDETSWNNFLFLFFILESFR